MKRTIAQNKLSSQTTTSVTFTFPWFYNMPPFFTLQPVIQTRKNQLDMWAELILSYTSYNKIYEMDVIEVAKSPLFVNSAINRRLSVEGIIYILDDLVGRGNGEWQNKEKTRFTVFWRSPAQWGELIYKWVNETGQLNSVMTVFEIKQGDDSEGQEFHGLESTVLMKALKTLESIGKAQVFQGNQTDECGVKFFQV